MAGSSDSIGMTPQVRVRPLVVRLLAALVLPVALAFVLDRTLGASPWLTLTTLVICIPVATVLVLRSALHDMDSVIAAVAPVDAGGSGVEWFAEAPAPGEEG